MPVSVSPRIPVSRASSADVVVDDVDEAEKSGVSVVGDGKEEEENLRAEVKMDVELSGVDEGSEVMKDPRDEELHRPDRTGGMTVQLTSPQVTGKEAHPLK